MLILNKITDSRKPIGYISSVYADLICDYLAFTIKDTETGKSHEVDYSEIKTLKNVFGIIPRLSSVLYVAVSDYMWKMLDYIDDIVEVESEPKLDIRTVQFKDSRYIFVGKEINIIHLRPNSNVVDKNFVIFVESNIAFTLLDIFEMMKDAGVDFSTCKVIYINADDRIFKVVFGSSFNRFMTKYITLKER